MSAIAKSRRDRLVHAFMFHQATVHGKYVPNVFQEPIFSNCFSLFVDAESIELRCILESSGHLVRKFFSRMPRLSPKKKKIIIILTFSTRQQVHTPTTLTPFGPIFPFLQIKLYNSTSFRLFLFFFSTSPYFKLHSFYIVKKKRKEKEK